MQRHGVVYGHPLRCPIWYCTILSSAVGCLFLLNADTVRFRDVVADVESYKKSLAAEPAADRPFEKGEMEEICYSQMRSPDFVGATVRTFDFRTQVAMRAIRHVKQSFLIPMSFL
jgi:hypothetical protein